LKRITDVAWCDEIQVNNTERFDHLTHNDPGDGQLGMRQASGRTSWSVALLPGTLSACLWTGTAGEETGTHRWFGRSAAATNSSDCTCLLS